MLFLALAAILFGLVRLFSALNNQTMSDYARSVLKTKKTVKG